MLVFVFFSIHEIPHILLQHHISHALILSLSLSFSAQVSAPYSATENTRALTSLFFCVYCYLSVFPYLVKSCHSCFSHYDAFSDFLFASSIVCDKGAQVYKLVNPFDVCGYFFIW